MGQKNPQNAGQISRKFSRDQPVTKLHSHLMFPDVGGLFYLNVSFLEFGGDAVPCMLELPEVHLRESSRFSRIFPQMLCTKTSWNFQLTVVHLVAPSTG